MLQIYLIRTRQDFQFPTLQPRVLAERSWICKNQDKFKREIMFTDGLVFFALNTKNSSLYKVYGES